MVRFTVRTLLTPSGERLPILLNRSTGTPVYYPNLYVLTVLRQTNRASATIERALREISVLLDFLATEGIDLDERMSSGRLFTLGEIDGLARYCRQSVKLFRGGRGGATSVIQLDDNRSRSAQTVSHTTSANRLRTFHSYLVWLITKHLDNRELDDFVRSKLEQIVMNDLSALKARIQIAKGRNSSGARKGLTPVALERLLQVIDPASPDNPWKSEFARQRNALILCWLLQLGLRRGELLNVKITDIDFRKNEVLIARRPDDLEDPRRDQPKVKTRDRILSLGVELASLSHNYVIEWRSQSYGARKNRYLFTSSITGAPLSLQSINKLFQKIRVKIPDLPDNLTAHMMRHTWNDEFSKFVKSKKIKINREEQMRNYIMGWSPTSTTATIYTKRFVEEAARQASCDLQEKLSLINKNSEQ